jgi:hypothetical protein
MARSWYRVGLGERDEPGVTVAEEVADGTRDGVVRVDDAAVVDESADG